MRPLCRGTNKFAHHKSAQFVVLGPRLEGSRRSFRPRRCRRRRRRRAHHDPARREAPAAPDHVQRNFTATIPNQLWVADITYIPTWAGFLFLAKVLDVYSRRIVGWAMATHLKTDLVLDALNMALAPRRPAGVIHHSESRQPIHLRRVRTPLPHRGRGALHWLPRWRLTPTKPAPRISRATRLCARCTPSSRRSSQIRRAP